MLEFLNDNSGALMVLFTAVVTISTVVYAFLTFRLTSETRLMRRAQTEPKIEIFVKPREEWINVLNLYVRNIGMGPAFNVKFEFEAEAGLEGAEMLLKDFTESVFLNNGLRYLGPGHQVESNISTMLEGFDRKIQALVRAEISYTDAYGRRFKDIFHLDFSEFRGLGRLGKPHLHAMAQSVEKIQEAITGIVSGSRRLRVDVFTERDRARDDG